MEFFFRETDTDTDNICYAQYYQKLSQLPLFAIGSSPDTAINGWDFTLKCPVSPPGQRYAAVRRGRGRDGAGRRAEPVRGGGTA